LKNRAVLGLNSYVIKANDLPAISPSYGNALKVLVESWSTLKITGVSLEFVIVTV
jgi:hypothetical protein